LSIKLIEAKNLKKTFGDFVAVDNINLNVERGEVVGFLGPNGAGKSTTMKMLTGFLEPDGGEIFIEGIDLKSKPLEAKKIYWLSSRRSSIIFRYGSFRIFILCRQNERIE